jgi:hypothetical protein
MSGKKLAGNWVLIGDDSVEATAYQTGDEWSGIWNGAPDDMKRRLKAKHPPSEEAILRSKPQSPKAPTA